MNRRLVCATTFEKQSHNVCHIDGQKSLSYSEKVNANKR
jgi:hypothetical protein